MWWVQMWADKIEILYCKSGKLDIEKRVRNRGAGSFTILGSLIGSNSPRTWGVKLKNNSLHCYESSEEHCSIVTKGGVNWI